MRFISWLLEHTKIKYPVYLTVGGIGSIITSAFGGWTNGLIFLGACMIVDFITGVIVSIVFKNSPKTETGAYSSKIGFKGICKKAVIVMIIWLMHLADIALLEAGLLPVACLANGTIIFFCSNEIGSIIENLGGMNMNIPAPVKKAFDILNKKIKSDSKEDTEEIPEA